MTISVITITFLLHFKTANGAVINYTFLPITFVFLLLYTLALVTFIFAVTTLFSNGKTFVLNTENLVFGTHFFRIC